MDEHKKYASTKAIKNIAFFGDADISPADETYKHAFDTAELLAQNGYVVVDGGGAFVDFDIGV
jgi:predicted Rossmann-fold nucleotide-binding protein